jgi:multiple sugar transport system permease protein
LLLNGLALVAAMGALLPLLWLVCASFKTGEDLFAYTFLPWDGLNRLTLGNFTTLVTTQPAFRWLFNSLFLASAQTFLSLILASMAGYALARHRFRGRGEGIVGPWNDVVAVGMPFQSTGAGDHGVVRRFSDRRTLITC